MTSHVAVIGLAFDDFDLQRADLDIHFEITEGLDELPNTRGSDQVIPFRTGLLASRRVAHNRPIVATGWVAGPPTSLAAVAYRAYVDSIKVRIDPTAEPRILVATLEDGSKRWTYAVARNLIGGPAMGSDFRPFSIEWDAADPLWYGAWGTLTLDAGLFLDDGLALDGSAEIVVAGSADYVLVNPGTAQAERVRVAISGPSAGPVGVEVIGAEPVGFAYPALAAGQLLTVDNHERTVVLTPGAGPSVNGRKDLTLRPGNEHGEYLHLPPGSQTIRVTGGATTTRIRFTPTYL